MRYTTNRISVPSDNLKVIEEDGKFAFMITPKHLF